MFLDYVLEYLSFSSQVTFSDLFHFISSHDMNYVKIGDGNVWYPKFR